ncbi:hypothetical protein IscW_ISCW001433 [Ixodes scapularis]|uniref:Uncharacterized protein n=1 Tax=Ixodes scapularis TaxID=6945 RepID=B7P4J6_IXOSC|nr:hypothetical protein IscW_ISCW001433 [Ixodes scapularis]|eukprot:XP_002406124.1 hypothetical protein IscW_ISCW001433 [Ixodes scapularis]
MALGVPVVCSVRKTVGAVECHVARDVGQVTIADWLTAIVVRHRQLFFIFFIIFFCIQLFYVCHLNFGVGCLVVFLLFLISVWFVPDLAVFVLTSEGSGRRSLLQGLILHCCCFLSRGSDAIPVTPS